MRKKFAIIPAAVLTIGAATVGILANTAAAEKSGTKANYVYASSNDTEQTAEKTNILVVNSSAEPQNNSIGNNGFCDSYIDGVCWQNGTGCGYHNGNGNFVDNDNDGICDSYADGACPQDGTGSGYHHGNGNFVDDDNDGICDNYADGACPQNGAGNGHHNGNSNFVDNDNDGICDNYADGACPQNGTGNGHHRGKNHHH